MTISRVRRMAVRLGGFGLVPLLSMAAPLLLLPIVARVAGIDGWAAVAVGQSAGALAATIVAYGWGLTGPVDVATTAHEDHRRLWANFLCASALLIVTVDILACSLLMAIAPSGHKLLACAVAIGGSVLGISPDWYAIGLGRPRIIMLFNTGPRMIALAAVVPILLATRQVAWYPAALIAGPVAGLAFFSSRQLRPSRPEAGIIRTGVRELRRHRNAAVTSVTASVYSTGALLIVGVFATTTATAHVASVDKLFRFASQSVATLGRALQSWVVTPDRDAARARRRASLKMHAMLGVTGMLFFASAGPIATEAVFGPGYRPSAFTSAMYGVAFASLAINSSLGRHVLIPTGNIAAVFRSTVVGAVLGLPGIAIGAHAAGADGASAGFAASEVLVTMVQVGLILYPRRGGTWPR